ncbi:MAG TPA: hypothetical protein VKS00_08515 [Candidatus Acidoferrales bacterium]|nr:hypothetical protein [Candidatus Acidoferrales bacterium]
MTFSSTRRFGGGALLVVALICLSSCAEPLAPGYQIEKQSITVRFVPGAPPHLAIRAQYRLANVGTAPLDFIELGLPSEKGFGLANPRVKIDGREVMLQRESSQTSAPAEGETAVSEAWPETWRIRFESRWPRRQRKNLVLEYDLAQTSAPDPRISIASNAFYLNDSAWFPDPISAKALFAKDVVRPDPSDLIVDVPANFVATASGELRRARKTGDETELRFRLHKDDFDPYVVAGQYQQQRIAGSGVTVLFWTLQAFPPAILQQTATSLSATDSFLVSTFGAIRRASQPLLVVQAPAPGNSQQGLDDHSAVTLPGMILFSPPDFSRDTSTGAALAALGKRLALSWFQHVITPRPEARLLGGSLASYAVVLADEKSGAMAARDDLIRRRLTRFDQLGGEVAEKPIAFVTSGDTPREHEMAGAKSMLFLFALEDRCGRENLDHALAHMVYALRGQEYGYTDFRATLEQECHQDLSSMFATWLDQKGIPGDFRARYENATSK